MKAKESNVFSTKPTQAQIAAYDMDLGPADVTNRDEDKEECA